MNNIEFNYFVLVDFPEVIKDAIIYGEWIPASHEDSRLTKMQIGDILLFYCMDPIDGIVGFGTIKDKIESNGRINKIEFSRNYCLPYLFWKEERLNFSSFKAVDKGISWLSDKEEIIGMSNILNSKWGVELKNNIDVDMSEKPFFSKNKCIECGKELDSRAAKYCAECRDEVKQQQSLDWNRKNIDKIKEAGKRWRQNHPDKVREYNRRWKEAHPDKLRELRKRWREKHPDKVKEAIQRWKEKKKSFQKSKITKELVFFHHKNMSDWCKKLRVNSSHLLWLARQKKRKAKIVEIENKFNCCWEDKFKEVFEKHNHKTAARMLNLEYHTLFVWAKHLNLQRTCIYCRKKINIRRGDSHSKCKAKHELEQNKSGVRELLLLINPITINVAILDVNNNEVIQAVKDVLLMLPKTEYFVLENRYMVNSFKDRKTLEEVGLLLGGLTRERVRQIEAKAIKRLRHPSRQKLLREKLSRIIFRLKDNLEPPLSNKIIKMQAEINELQEKLKVLPALQTSIPLSEIEMSVRASNCLEKFGIKTLEELAKKTESKMLSIRNLGKLTLEELRQILHSYGLKFKSRTSNQYDENKLYRIKKKNRRCLFIGCNASPHKGQYCSKHKTSSRRNQRCLFISCNVIPHSGRYCSEHQTAWRRKRALELLGGQKELFKNENGIKEESEIGINVPIDKKYSQHTFEELKETLSKYHPRA